MLDAKKTLTKQPPTNLEFIGTVTEAKLVEATVYGASYRAEERYAKALKVTLETDGGQIVQFYSPSVQITVACPKGCPIAIVICEENDWIKKVQRQGEDKVIGENIESRIKLGDLITVKGRIKKSYNKSLTINYVKLTDLVPSGGKLSPKEYVFNSGDCIVIYDSKGRLRETTHKQNGFGWLKDSGLLEETLKLGYSFKIPLDSIESLKSNGLNHLLDRQESYYLACWLDNRREKPIVKKAR